MSHTQRDQTSAQHEPTPVANAPHLTQGELASEATPAKKKYGPDLAYASAVKTFEEVRYHLGKEMNGRWLGAMPVDAFLDKYVPATEEPLPDLHENPFQGVPRDGVESTRYEPFITAIEGWLPHLQAVNTSKKDDTVNDLKLKTDISIFNRVDGVVPPDRTDFSRMELWMEFKTKKDGAPFQDPSDVTEKERLLSIEKGSFTPNTAEGNQARGQLAHYAGAQHSMQFRHHSFSVFLQGDHARFLRWDPSATVVTAAFNYRTNPRMMAEFLWRFDHLSPRDRGHDESVQPADFAPEIDTRVREKLGIKDDNIPLYKYKVPGLVGVGHAYGPRPPTQNRSLVSRCTRSLPVVWIPTEEGENGLRSCGEVSSLGPHDTDLRTGQSKQRLWSEERIIYMKDTWRFLSDSPDVEVMPEHEIYEILHHHKTPNIPEHVAGGDVDGGRTQTQELVDAPWLCVRPRISPYQHYRLAQGIVGRPLFKFECTKQLVKAVFDALQAHSHASSVAKILHRDISAGNIILTNEGRGLLIDWELAKMMDEGGSRRPDRTGTWQFMSANLLQHPGKVHTLTNDLESFLHVLAWMMLRYVPASDAYDAEDRGRDMLKFDEHSIWRRRFDHGGDRKCDALRGGSYPSVAFDPQTPTPLFDLLRQLSSPFRSLYAVRRPTDDDRRRVQVRPDSSDRELYRLWDTVDQYDEDIRHLESHIWFENEMEKALNEDVWPTSDKADENLPIASSNDTDRQVQNKISQLQKTRSVWESTGLSRNSKCAASPTPESSAKRRCGTPAASGSGFDLS